MFSNCYSGNGKPNKLDKSFSIMSRKITRRTIQIALGLLWLLDGALQLQRQMFTRNFATQIIAPSAQGQPAIISGPIHFATHTILLHPALWDSLFALIQLSLGVLILWKRTTRYGLQSSVVWGLAVWYIGEGLGGLANGSASLLMGAPGAALLYAIIALGVLPTRSSKSRETHRPAAWLAIVWAVVWLGGATLQLTQGQNTTADLSSMIGGMANGAPGWLASFDKAVSQHLNHASESVIIGLVIVQALIGILILLPRHWRTLAVFSGIIVSLCFWASGQAFGTYYTGLATDPNSAPLIILLGIAVLGSKRIALDIF
jgi:hypothetical protein